MNYNSYSIFSNLTLFLLNYKFYCLILNYHLIPSPSFHPATRRHLRNYHSIPIATICKFANSYLSQILIFAQLSLDSNRNNLQIRKFIFVTNSHIWLQMLLLCSLSVIFANMCFPSHSKGCFSSPFPFPLFSILYYREKHRVSFRIKFVYQLWLISINI